MSFVSVDVMVRGERDRKREPCSTACLCIVYLLMRLYIMQGCLTASLALAAAWDRL